MGIAGCGSYSSKPVTTVLPSSNRSIDIVLHRGDVRVMDCATLAVLQTYDATGRLIDSKEARGNALHCAVIPALIDAGGRVGAAAIVKPAITTIRNATSQLQWQNGSVVSTNTATATGGSGGAGGGGGSGGGEGGGSGGAGGNGGNNGQGNGTDDGTNNGSDNHHDNGDNT